MNYKIEKLNGIDCVFVPVEGINSVTVQIMAKAGSNYENRDNNGISHFLEHMFFKGGKRYKTAKSVVEVVDNFGGEFNAYTSDDETGYYIKCSPQSILKSIDVLSDMLVNARFPKDEIEKEKNVVIQEIKMKEDMPQSLVYDKRSNFFFGDNSFGWSTLGKIENIKNMDQDKLFEHKNNLYTKDNILIVVAGKIENIDDVKSQIINKFKNLNEKKNISDIKFPGFQPNSKSDFFDKKTEQNHIIISAEGLDGYDENKYSCKILTTILGGNMSSRLFQNIREKHGLCYYIGSSHISLPYTGLFYVRAGLQKDKFDFGVEKIFEEIQKIAKGDFFEEEFENAKNYNKGILQMGLETSNSIADFVGDQYLLYKEILGIEEFIQKIDNVKYENVKKIAKMLDYDSLYHYWIQ